ncbi:hypothetical protein CEN44_05450 [Fischerella muscicola CCMEE 5323]|uniref:Uncharacterized protein n=1 Tax=Fischerella muscicola CCMEE 5323 TaxID=2019572 RepID=A0A2N6K6K2_FISMU|nr:hypothetical protein [Fischerella muscicola]PLZ92592.1 hypothetical protein CEN44_05450 [Fischerella muscicola CCMEE 5323]
MNNQINNDKTVHSHAEIVITSDTDKLSSVEKDNLIHLFRIASHLAAETPHEIEGIKRNRKNLTV